MYMYQWIVDRSKRIVQTCENRLKVISHSHVFEIGVLFFTDSDIIIQIRTRDLE